MLDIKESGKVYPLSNEAKSVTNLLDLALKDLGLNTFCEEFIEDVLKVEEKFVVKTKEKEFKTTIKL